MLAMQYSVRLPRDFDVEQVYAHVSERSLLFEGCPGLKHKFYLYDPDAHIYAPFYIWENAQAAQDFLLNNLFNGVIERFGRPRVRSWQIIEMDFGSYKEEPGFLLSSIDKLQATKPLGGLIDQEKAYHRENLRQPGLYAHMVLLDADRWEIGRFGLWQSEDKAIQSPADCVVGYNVLKMNQDLRGAA